VELSILSSTTIPVDHVERQHRRVPQTLRSSNLATSDAHSNDVHL